MCSDQKVVNHRKIKITMKTGYNEDLGMLFVPALICLEKLVLTFKPSELIFICITVMLHRWSNYQDIKLQIFGRGKKNKN